MPNQTASPPESITELQAQLTQFRSTHPLRTRLPLSLWQSAAELARCHGLYLLARSLKLDYCTLKKHISGSPESIRTEKKSRPKFVELIGATRQSADHPRVPGNARSGRSSVTRRISNEICTAGSARGEKSGDQLAGILKHSELFCGGQSVQHYDLFVWTDWQFDNHHQGHGRVQRHGQSLVR